LKERGIKDMSGIQALVKELTSDLYSKRLMQRLRRKLDTPKYDYKNKAAGNSSNGYS
jgi:hypothetical protein